MLVPQKKKSPHAGTLRIIGKELLTALKILLFFILLFIAVTLRAQPGQSCNCSTAGTIIDPNAHGSALMRKPVPYPFVREADVMWSKRIWRTIDLREKMNHPYYYPETPHNGLMSLFDLIRCGVLGGCVSAFGDPIFDDDFTIKLSPEEVANLLIVKNVVQQEDPANPGTYKNDTVVQPLASSEIKGYWIKEDWFFDKQRSVMDVRIIGICPMQQKTDPATGEMIGFVPLFWIYFPELRPLLAKQEVFLGPNFSQLSTYDDIFQKRFFSSYIMKESNVYDRTVNSYATGLDALLESERIKTTIMDFESDLWHY